MSSATTQTWTARRTSSDDTDAIVSLINAHSRHHNGEERVSTEEVRSWFRMPRVEQDDTHSWWGTDGKMSAYAQVYRPDFPPTWDALYDATVHPNAAGDDALWDEIFEWCDGRKPEPNASSSNQSECRRCGARIYENDADKRRQYESRGFRQVRTETLMRVALDEAILMKPESPSGIEIRRFDPEKEMEGYAMAYGEAFRDHWGHLEIPPEEQARRKRAEFESWGEMFVPDLWFVALDGGTIVGSVGSFLNYGNVPGRCYLYHVFVRREWRNRRIAKALLHTAFRALKVREGRTVELHVDSENMTYGLELYRGFGMRPVWHQHLYERTVHPQKT